LMWKRMVTPLDIWMWKWFFRKIFPTKPNPIDVTTGRLQPGEQCTIRCREPYYVQNWDVQITIILDSQKSVRKLRRFYRRKISIKVSTCPYYYQIWYSLIFDRTDIWLHVSDPCFRRAIRWRLCVRGTILKSDLAAFSEGTVKHEITIFLGG
jgi:hypothetical protein